MDPRPFDSATPRSGFHPTRTCGAAQAIFHEMGFPVSRAWLPGAVAYSVARTYNLLVRQLSQLYHRFGLTPASFNLLMLLKHGTDPESMTQQRIGACLVVSASDMTGLVDRLEKKGLVQRAPGKDRRSNCLRITAKGSKLLDAVWPHHVAAIERLTSMLHERETHALVAALAKVRRGHDTPA